MKKETHSVVVDGYEVTGEVEYEWIDDSFDHSFGTEHCGHVEGIDVNILEVYKDDKKISTWNVPAEVLKEAIEQLKLEKV